MNRKELSAMSVTELKSLAKEMKIAGYQKLRKAELIDTLAEATNSETDDEATDEKVGRSDNRTSSDVSGSIDDSDDNDSDDDDDDTDESDSDDGEDDEEDNNRRNRRGRRKNNNRRERNNDRGSRKRTRGRSNDEDDTEDEEVESEDLEDDDSDDSQEDNGPEVRAGVLDILPEGYGFMRTTGYLPGPRDAYVSQGQIRKYGLRRGDIVQGPIRPQRSNDKVPAIAFVEMINSVEIDSPDDVVEREEFDYLPAVKAEQELQMPGSSITINRGERMIIGVPAPILATEMLADIAENIVTNNDNLHLMLIDVDDAPEEITLLQRTVSGEVIASAFDRTADDHTQVSDLALERAKRLVEQGWDVVIILNSLNRLAKAWSLCAPNASRVQKYALEQSAIHPVKRLLGAGRNIDGEGSLTVIVTLETNTGRPIDEVVSEEFSYMASKVVMLEADGEGNLK